MSSPSHLEFNAGDRDRDSSAAPAAPPGLLATVDEVDVTSAEGDILYSMNDAPPYSVTMQNRRESAMSRWSAVSRGSVVSHVDIGHFDPAGVEELRRSLHSGSDVQHVQLEDANKLTRKMSGKSDVTLTPGDGPIDFEKTLRTIMKK
jgi:ATP-binding cassette subfamily G (WHITE) protein 2 (SNQ2)